MTLFRQWKSRITMEFGRNRLAYLSTFTLFPTSRTNIPFKCPIHRSSLLKSWHPLRKSRERPQIITLSSPPLISLRRIPRCIVDRRRSRMVGSTLADARRRKRTTGVLSSWRHVSPTIAITTLTTVVLTLWARQLATVLIGQSFRPVVRSLAWTLANWRR